ncbi:MAG TPA: NAD(P)H-dependent oxidoreductase [Nocardioides sp.]
MPRLLRIDSSFGPASRTRAVADAYVAAWTARGADFTTTVRDLAADPLPHLTSAALHWPPHLRDPADVPPPEAEALQQEVLAELTAADVLLLGAPLYNYSLPSTLKAWLDLVHVPGLTAPFDAPTQPCAGVPVAVLTARGGAYDDGSPDLEKDHLLPVLRLVLADALGMELHTIATNRTLADAVPALDPDRAAAELQSAVAAAEEHARTVLA